MSSIFGLVDLLTMVAIQLLFISNVSSLNLTNAYLHHKCINAQGKFKPGSAFEKSLNTVLRDVESTRENFHTGFFYPREGEEPNTAYVIYQCRGDSYGSNCRSCVNIAISELRKRCPRNKGAIIWYDQCLSVITSIYSYNKIDKENNFFLSNANNVSGDPKLFNKEVMPFLKDLIEEGAIKNKEGNKHMSYAVGEKKIGTEKLYTMVQCTKDLEAIRCYRCLDGLLEKFPECCDGKRGGRILGTNCNFRYEFYPFLRH